MSIRDQSKRRKYFREWQRIRRRSTQDAINAFKIATGCVDCGYNSHPEALQFDHLPGRSKLATVGSLLGSGSKDGLSGKAWQEVAKCEVVCANCHCIRTIKRRKGS